MSRTIKRVSRVLLIVLALSFFSPITQSSAATTVTKTFTINDHSGQPLAGALIQAWYPSDTAGNYAYTSIYTTNGSGIASVVLPIGLADIWFTVEPPAGNIIDAAYANDGALIDSNADQNITVNLKASNLVVELFEADGVTPAPISSWISYTSTGSANVADITPWILRLGAFGIALSTSLDPATNYVIMVAPDIRLGPANQTWNKYGLRNSTASPAFTPVIYEDPSFVSLTTVQPVAGVYQLKLDASNIQGQLQNSDGTSISLPAGVTGTVQMQRLDDNGYPRPSNADEQLLFTPSNIRINPDGTWHARSRGPNPTTAGKYVLTFRISGSSTIPSFKAYLWKDATGKFSATQNGTYEVATAAQPFVLQTKIGPPTSTFAFQVFAPNSATLSPSFMNFTDISFDSANAAHNFSIYTQENTGIGSVQIPDGTYTVNVQSVGINQTSTVYTLTVAGSTFTLTNPAGQSVSPSNGIYTFTTAAANFSFALVDPVTPATPLLGWIDYCLIGAGGKITSCNGVGVDSLGRGQAFIPTDGSYLIRVNPSGANSYGAKEYQATVTLGVVSITGVTALSGIFPLTANISNFSGTVTAPGGGALTFTGNQRINFNVQMLDANGNWNGTQYNQSKNSGTFGFNIIEPGTYRIQAVPYSYPTYAWAVSPEFTVAGNPAIATPNSANIALNVPNLHLTIRDPRTNSLLPTGYVNIFKTTLTGDTYLTGSGIDSMAPGIITTYLPDGDFRLEVAPQNIIGLARKSYTASVVGGVVTLSANAVPLTPTAPSFFDVSVASANVTGRLMLGGVPFIPGQNVWANINVQKFNTLNNSWEYTSNWANLDANGTFGVSVTDSGTYRLRIEPMGNPDATNTFTNQFEIDAANPLTVPFGDIALAGPSIKVRVVTAGSSVSQIWTGVAIFKDGQWLDWANTGPQGVAGISLTQPGKYKFDLYPSAAASDAGATRKSYSVTAIDTGGVISATADAASGVSVASGVTTLAFGTPVLSGLVKDPGGAVVQNATIVARDTTKQIDMWDYSTNSSILGKWAMALPDGTYSITARAPWGNSTLSDSLPIETVTVTNGVAALSGAAASLTQTTFNLNLVAPRWTGVIHSPTGSNVANASLCLLQTDSWSCANADSSGHFGLNSPNFSSFSANSILDIRDQYGVYPMKRITGPVAVSAALASGVIAFDPANVAITVHAGGALAPNVWINIDNTNGWLASSLTNASGQANLSIAPADLASGINVRADLGGNQSLNTSYASTSKSFTSADITASDASGQTFTGNLDLAVPNFHGELREPTVLGVTGKQVPYTWVDSYNTANGQWIGGVNTDSTGAFALNLPAPQTGGSPISYAVRVFAPNGAAGSLVGNEYQATITDTSVITFAQKSDLATAILPSHSGAVDVYATTLKTPSVLGTVVSGTAPNTVGVRDSWVVPIDPLTNEYLWQYGSNSVTGGNFGLALPNANYRIEANASWMAPGFAKSAGCNVTVTNGAVALSPGSSCIDANGKVQLQLRQPNLTFTLMGTDSKPVKYANVGIGFGAFYTNTQSDANGNVAIFIDEAAMAAGARTPSPLNTGDQMAFYMWFDPPYGSSSMVRWDCQVGPTSPKMICSSLTPAIVGTPYSQTDLGVINVLGPNRQLSIAYPNSGPVVQNAWVTLWKLVGGNRQWFAGASSTATGIANFNLDATDSTSTYGVEVTPPWNERLTFASKYFDNAGVGYTFAELTAQSYSLGSPNIKISVKAPGGTAPSKWGWLNIEEVAWDSLNNNYAFVSWVSGYGLDDNGGVSAFLAGGKSYKVTTGPGSGRPGVVSSCILASSNTDVVSTVSGSCSAVDAGTGAMTLTLESGNVTGNVKDSSSRLLPGAVIYAVDDSVPTNTVTTSTDSSGHFGIQLDPTKNWTIDIYWTSNSDLTVRKKLLGTTVLSADLSGPLSLGDLIVGNA